MLETYKGDAFRGELQAYDMETLAPTSNAAVGATAAKLAVSGKQPAVKIIAVAETQAIRYRLDGGAPSTTVGHLVAAGESFEVEGETNIKNLKIIAVTGTAGVTITFFRYQD